MRENRFAYDYEGLYSVNINEFIMWAEQKDKFIYYHLLSTIFLIFLIYSFFFLDKTYCIYNKKKNT